ncbi:molybdenum cofactor guanylyltransferase [Phenylobacterium sp.]|uniref:molybdenum cofactor guanylyltransferase n=1 Tax=Phenylobacterium sp. TaxID=1871053 RepID=UPI002737AAB1|nr:molybdenum cofactor guanylyltransferase [Phenylobacterium sp.]MDP3868009.1 molybdenum cofactor guanylyltransferase [Phenylobacterium sp.]
MTGVAVVLAGGEGRRMGGGKPLRAWGGRPLLFRAIELAGGYASQVAVAVREAGQAGQGAEIPLLFDPPEIGGPLAGLASALDFGRRCGATWVQTLACDMPYLPPDLSDRLAGALAPEVGAVLPTSGGRLHPICGLWRVGSRDRLEAYLTTGRSSLRGFAEHVGLREVAWDTPGADPFLNLNTLEDLAACQPSAVVSDQALMGRPLGLLG